MIEFAARQGDPVAHSSKFSWGVIGAIAGGVLVVGLLIVFPPAGIAAAIAGEAVTAGAVATGVAAAVSTTAAGIGAGKTVGELAGSYHINPNAGDIADGSPTVFTGLGQPKAARMSDPLRCHKGEQVATGSRTVFMDVPLWCASRKLDYTSCGGQISDGCPNVHIGGDPVARPGVSIKEKPGTGYKVTFLTIDIVGTVAGLWTLPANLGKWGTSKLADAASVAKILGTGIKVEGWTEVPSAKEQDLAASPVLKGIGAANDFVTGALTKQPDKLVKLGADSIGALGKTGAYFGGPGSPHVPSYPAGGP